MLEQGMYVAERYEIIEKIGTGGMSDVYLAKDVILGRMVAIKVLKAEYSEDASFVTKFRTEAQSAAGLEHPNIVNVYDVGVEDGLYYIVMEYVEGVTLKTYIEKKGQLNYKEAISIAIQVGRGIEAAHNKGIIHRDIKPQNIMISTEGKVKVTDFGIARAATSNTIHADVMGSVHYSSPEQARNGFVDGKSDIYSLGIVMYEMVTGRVPFDGESTVAIAIQHLQEEMVNPITYAPDLPISLEKIILKATMKSPDRRYPSITDLLTDLKKALISPDEDFVVILDAGIEKTRIMTMAEQELLSKQAGAALAQSIEEEVESAKREARRGRSLDLGREEEEEEYDVDDDGDDDIDPNMEKIFTILGIAAGAVIVTIIVVILGNIFGLFHFGKNSKIAMINVVGETEKVAYDELVEEGFNGKNITFTYKEDDSVGNGIVIEQSIEAGKKVKASEEIELTVAKNAGLSDDKDAADKEDKDDKDSDKDKDKDKDKKEEEKKDKDDTVKVPNVLDTSEDSAVKALQDVGLSYTRSYQYDNKVASGKVISQSPSAGSTAKAGDKITLVISQGQSQVEVPDVAKLYYDDAVAALTNAGLKVTSTSKEYSSDVAANYVISQSIAAGKKVDAGTNITLVMSKGPKVYSYSFKNPYGVTASVKLPDGKTYSLESNGTITFDVADKSEVSITCVYKETVTEEKTDDAGNKTTSTSEKEVTKTENLTGTLKN